MKSWSEFGIIPCIFIIVCNCQQEEKFIITLKDTQEPPFLHLEDITNIYHGFQFNKKQIMRQNDEENVSHDRFKFTGKQRSHNDIKVSSNMFEGLPWDKYPTLNTILDETIKGDLPENIWRPFHSKALDSDFQGGPPNSWISNAILKYLGSLYLPDKKLIDNEDCIKDLNIIYNPEFHQSFYVALLLDSWGKLPDGFFAGNTQTFGSFDECLMIHFLRNRTDQSKGYFKGQYCTVGYRHDSNLSILEARAASITPIINAAPILTAVFAYGTCIPSTCTEKDLSVSIAHHLVDRGLNLNVSGVACQVTESPSVEFTAGTITFIVLVAVEGTLIIVGGLLDAWINYVDNDDLRKGPLKYLLAFSFYTNLEKMFHINTTENKDTISCIHGIRVLSMTWVVLGHQYGMWLFAANKTSLPWIFNDNFAIQAVANAYPSVDTFFFMSGLLVAYSVFREQEKGGKFNIVLYYVHRILRISPPILLFCGFLASFQVPLGKGPLAPLAQQYVDNCRGYWYRDALFLSNFHGRNENIPSCLIVSWYTSVDSQLYLVAPLFLLPFILKNSSQNLGVIWLTFLTMLSVVIPGSIIGVNRLPPHPVLGIVDNVSEYRKYFYGMPWCRASPYLAGIWLAYIFRLNRKEKINLSLWQVLAGWTVAIGLGVAVVFGMYNYNQFAVIEYNWAISIFYGSLHALAWGMTLAWVIFACQNGYGGPINSFLSHPFWQPLSRLSYCMFIIALSFQEILTSRIIFPFYYSHVNKIMETVGVLFLSGLGAIFLSLYTEGPILGLEKLLLRK